MVTVPHPRGRTRTDHSGQRALTSSLSSAVVRWSDGGRKDEKARIVQEIYAPGMSVPLVARGRQKDEKPYPKD